MLNSNAESDLEALKTIGGAKEDMNSKEFLKRAISNPRAETILTKEFLQSRPHIPYTP